MYAALRVRVGVASVAECQAKDVVSLRDYVL